MKKLKFIVIIVLLALLNRVEAQKVETLILDSFKAFEAINWLPDGRILVADYTNGRLYKIDLGGNVETIVTGFGNIAGGGLDKVGNFYFSGISNGTVNRLEPDGTFTQVASGFNQPVGILPSKNDGEIYLAVYGENAVYKVNVVDGSKQQIAKNKGINGPDGMVFNKAGDLLVANFNNNVVNKIDSNKNVTLFAQLPSAGFAGYIAKNDDFYFIPSIAGHKIYQITEDGTVTEFAGSGQKGTEDGDLASASFSDPNGIALNPAGDTMLIADGARIRIITGFQGATSSLTEVKSMEITIGPNPCTDHISVTSGSAQNLGKFQIYDSSGTMVMVDSMSLGQSVEIKTDTLKAGVYSIVVQSADAKENRVLSFVKM